MRSLSQFQYDYPYNCHAIVTTPQHQRESTDLQCSSWYDPCAFLSCHESIQTTRCADCVHFSPVSVDWALGKGQSAT
jgi:hypothetical protein